MRKLQWILIAVLFIWVGFVFSAFYIVQKPLFLQVSAGLLSVVRTLAIVAGMILEAGALGGWALRKFIPDLDAGERILLGTGLGLGAFGLLGFGLAAAQAARLWVFLLLLLGLFLVIIVTGQMHFWWEDLKGLTRAMREPVGPGLKWIAWAAAFGGFFSFLLAFAPPVEAFDALLYHLSIPAAWLKDGGLAFSPIIPHYWFPALVEGTFVWGLALGSETVAPLLHLTWGILTASLIWWWALKAYNAPLAWRSMAILISMPSLLLLAAWAYADLALVFYSLASLYACWTARRSGKSRGWVLAGVFSGLAMGVKYTSFILPLVILGTLVLTRRQQFKELAGSGVRFALPAVLVASPWYIRNWIWTGNPFFPFLFGGRSWDAFLAAHYSQPGTGIGFDPFRLLLLPLDITLGQHDANYYDGRIGPLWLILLPVCLWMLWRMRNQPGKSAVYIPALFGLASLGVWTVGVISTSALWQSRLLFPALLPLAPLAALAWESFTRLDNRRLHFSFIFNVLAVFCIGLNLLDFGLFVLNRNPAAVALGMADRQAYIQRQQPSYGDALSLVSQTPPESRIYFLFEPRSYGMRRSVTPDAINSNLAHDLWLYHTPENILHEWQAQGYAYVLYQRAGDRLVENPAEAARLFSMMDVVAQTSNTILYKIPAY